MGPTGGQKERHQRNNCKALLYKNSLDPYFITSFESILSVSGLALHKNKIWNIVKNFFIQKFHNHKKAQSAYKGTKIKNALKKHLRGK